MHHAPAILPLVTHSINALTALFVAFWGFPLTKWVRKYIKEKLQRNETELSEMNKRIELVEKSIKGQVGSSLALLHDRVYSEGNMLISQGWVTTDQLTNFEKLYTAYHNLGGNGTGEIIYNHVKELDIRSGETAYTAEAERKHNEERH